jgi:Pilus assembly protein, PilO
MTTTAVSPRKLVLLMAATIAILAAAAWFMLIVPRQSKANDLSTSIANAQTQLITSKTQSSSAGGGDDVSAREELRLERALPDALAMPQVVLQLSRIATEVHVTLQSITPAAATPYSGFTAVPMTVIVSGAFPDVEAFMREIRTQVQGSPGDVKAIGRLYDVTSVNFQETTPAPKITATLTMNTFYYTGIPLTTPTSSSTTTTTST